MKRVKAWIDRLNLAVYWPYIALAAIILGPLLQRGYVLTLDMVFTPTVQLPETSAASYPFYGLLYLLSHVLPVDILQKLLLLMIFIGSGIGAHRLISFIKPKTAQNWELASYFAGIFYVINPFTYARLMAGQFAVLLGYMLLPFIVRALLQFIDAPSYKSMAKVVLLVFVASAVSIHSLGFIVLIALCSLPVLLYKKPVWKKAVRTGAIGAAIFVALSAYWLVPFITGNSSQSQQVQGFTQADQSAFATDDSYLGVIGNVMALHGFWAEAENVFSVPQDASWNWLGPTIALWLLVGVGAWAWWQANRKLAVVFGLIGVASVVLATGSKGSLFAPFNSFLANTIPFFSGYREPQKFVAALVLCYAVFGAYGASAIARALKQWFPAIAPVVAGLILLVPVFSAPYMLWGARTQLQAASYPTDWYEAKTYLKEHENGKTLFLPWHQYMRYDFAGRIIASPVEKFFDVTAIYSHDPEMSGVHYKPSPDESNVQKAIIPQILSGQGNITGQLRNVGITHVVVFKEHDYQRYNSLMEQPALHTVMNTTHIIVYKVDT